MSVAKKLKFHGASHELGRFPGSEKPVSGVVRERPPSRAAAQQGPGARLRFNNFSEARSFLQRSGVAYGGVAAWRVALVEELSAGVVSRMSDAEVTEHFARRLTVGHLHVRRAAIPGRAYRLRAPEKIDDALGPEPEPQSDDVNLVSAEVGGPFEPIEVHAEVAGVAEPEEIQGALGEEPAVGEPEFDTPDQVATLVEAAQRGAPYCEECEKARLALLQAPEEDESANLDVPAQVAAMQTAAAAGAPFCEECEKARLALAAQAAPPAPDEDQAEAEEEQPDVDVASQAAVMHGAADDGTPFCEECEKLKAARAAAAA